MGLFPDSIRRPNSPVQMFFCRRGSVS